jgi:hypothetical protein
MRNLEDNTLLLLVVVVSLAFAWILWPFYEAVRSPRAHRGRATA